MRGQRHFLLQDESQVGEARRYAAQLGERIGLDQTAVGRIAIIATELGRNVVRHGGGGTMMIHTARRPAHTGVEFIAVDSGPGMADPAQCLRDGFSTGGTPGTGLGALRRLASSFDLHSVAGAGTVIMARVQSAPAAGPEWVEWGAISTAAPGEPISGDAWEVAECATTLSILIMDGLGHGLLAAAAADAGTAVFREAPFESARAVLTGIHTGLHGTRGAAGAVARCDRSSGAIAFGGVGNISASLVTSRERPRGMASFNGTLGIRAPSVRELQYHWDPHDLLIMHSDGIQTRWSADDQPGLLARHPSVIAAVLHRDFMRGRDDATIVVARRTA